MYIIIAGCRKVGSNLAMSLAQLNHDVVVIDSDPSNFEALGSGFNGVTITGIPIDEDILRSAGIEQADCLAAVTNDDNMNMMISQIARQLFHVPQVITRVYDPRRDVVFRQMGLTTLCPTSLAVERIKDYLLKSSESVNHDFFGTEVLFTSVKPNKKQIGKPLSELKDDSIFGFLRDNRFVLSRPEFVIEANDTLVVSTYNS
jgi:trk system potassium uptake protein TrkA